jgi:hypothetical protein
MLYANLEEESGKILIKYVYLTDGVQLPSPARICQLRRILRNKPLLIEMHLSHI